MFGSGILDTVIGLMFVFLLVSMLVTIMNEMIAAFFLSRARWLRLGIERLLGTEWAKQMYAHPLIEGTAQNGDAVAAGRDGPSYIPSRSFANVLMDVIQRNSKGIVECQHALRAALDSAAAAGATVESLKAQIAAECIKLRTTGRVGAAAAIDLAHRLDAPTGPDTRKWLADLDARLGELKKLDKPELDKLLQTLAALVADGVSVKAGAAELRTRFNDAVEGLLTGPASGVLKDELTAMGKRLQGPYTVADARADIQWFIDGMSARYVRQMLEELPEGRMHDLLLTLFEDAKNDAEKFKENIEIWFNNAMDRVNGWYKRHSQWVVAGLAVFTVIAMNIDAIAIVKHLQVYPGAREALVEQAKAYTKPPAEALAPPAKRSINSGERYSDMLPLKEPSKGETVEVSSDNPMVEVLTPSVKIEEGKTEVPFTLDTRFFDKPSSVRIKFKRENNPTEELLLALKPGLPAQFQAVQANIAALSLPIGWVRNGTSAEVENGQILPSGLADIGRLVLQHGFGWFLTVLAATLGAPFWFDTLNRIISIRSAGKAPEEEPKPPKSVSVPVEPGQSPQEADRLNRDDSRRASPK